MVSQVYQRPKKRYIVSVPVLEAEGRQRFAVDAESPEEAIAEWKRTGGDFLDEEAEITALDHHNAKAEEDDG